MKSIFILIAAVVTTTKALRGEEALTDRKDETKDSKF